MRTLTVKTKKPYDVFIGKGISSSIGEKCVSLFKNTTRILLVSDSNVFPLYGSVIIPSLEKSGFKVIPSIFEAGEESKNISVYANLLSTAAKYHLNRDDAVIALGGGVTGDLAGFVAATYMRGIKVAQVPTTLLAGIDSSIGGKTGLDLPEGKNLVGAFKQPEFVLFDIDFLKTLPEKEWKNGMGEGVKYAVLDGGRTADLVENGITEETTEEFVFLCAKYKAEIVSRDEKEGGLRQLLNLGHTVAHAEEKLSGYKVPHGEAVSAGIEAMAKASFKRGTISENDYERIKNFLDKYGLSRLPLYPNEKIAEETENDKKQRNDGLNIVEILGVGNCVISKIPNGKFADYLNGD